MKEELIVSVTADPTDLARLMPKRIIETGGKKYTIIKTVFQRLENDLTRCDFYSIPYRPEIYNWNCEK